MTLLEPAERCEQATGPDREIDGRIHFSVVLREPWPSDGMKLVDATEQFEDSRDTVARYTASLDAAMTLVPEGWVGLLGIPANGGCKLQPEDEPQNAIETRAATPALALCAAALKARAHA